MKHLRTRAYRRHQRRRVIQRKLSFAQFCWGLRDNPKQFPIGYFAKGKVHCSCGMCTYHKQFPTLQEQRARQKETCALRDV